MENIVLRRNYLFSDPYLYQICNEKIVIAGRDSQKIFSEEITPAILSGLNSQNTVFKDLPSEYELTFKIEEAREAKSYVAAQLRTGIRTVLLRINNKTVPLPLPVQMLEKPCLEQLTDIALLAYGKSIVQILSPFLADLRETGLTPAMISTLSKICYEYDFAIDKLRKTVSDCEKINAQRIKIGNQIYEELMALCNKGKEVWAGINEAKYNDYVIYNTTNARPESARIHS